MKIQLEKIDTARFDVLERRIDKIGNVVLVKPKKTNWEWADDELHLRSLLCNPDGQVVSAGFPKFFNYGERPAADRQLESNLDNAIITPKLDGSLIIRSLIDGHVHFRTRGCESIADNMREPVERLIRDRYPELLEPKGRPDTSDLFEYTAPENQIVVRHDEARLTSIGTIIASHVTDRLWIWEPKAYTQFRSVPKVEEIPLRKSQFSDLSALIYDVKGRTAEEGVVLWVWNGWGASYHLTKFKSLWYIRLHVLRTQCTPRYLREYVYVNKIRSREDLTVALAQDGFDFETVSFVGPMFDELQAEMDGVDRQIAAAWAEMQALDDGSRDRKVLALRAKEVETRHPGTFGFCLFSALGETDKAQELQDSMRLGMTLGEFRAFLKRGLEKPGSGSYVDDT